MKKNYLILFSAFFFSVAVFAQENKVNAESDVIKAPSQTLAQQEVLLSKIVDEEFKAFVLKKNLTVLPSKDEDWNLLIEEYHQMNAKNEKQDSKNPE